jgi:hypothetical protein
MNKKALIPFFSALAMTGLSTAAQAACGTEGGYVYIWQTCVQEEVSWKPKNICEVPEGRETQTIVITSNVFHDGWNNGRYPASVFFDEVQLQLNLTLNGRESHCYRTRREAEDGLRDYLASQKRLTRGGIRFVNVRMPNT